MKIEYQKPRDEAIEKIENYIIKNGLQADDQLPSERKMCEMWNFNRTTLRSAIKQLISQGIIYNKTGSGTYVAREKVIRNLRDIKGLHQAAVEAQREITSQILGLKLCETSKNIGQKMKLPLGHKVWRLERVRSLDGVPVTISTIFLDAKRFPGLDEHDLSNASLYTILRQFYGVEAQSGYEKLSISSCDEREAQYLAVEQGSPVIYQSGVTSDSEDRIFEYFKEITRSEYVCFASELTRKPATS
ncbi:GntR family transcriptional regulator [Roseburia hominis]